MNEEAAKHIGSGLAWFGFWLMIGLANFGESRVELTGVLGEAILEAVSMNTPEPSKAKG